MIKEIDKRNFSAFKNEDNRFDSLIKIASDTTKFLKGGRIKSLPEFNTWTGNMRFIHNEQPVMMEGTLIQRALNYLQEHNASFGFSESESAEYMPDANIAETSSGLKIVNVTQYYKGIPVFLVNKTVVFDKDGGIESVIGDSVTFEEPIDIRTRLSVTDAANKVASYIIESKPEEEKDWLGEPIKSSFSPKNKFVAKKLVEFPELTCIPTVLDKSVFADLIRAHLVIFYVGPKSVLSWRLTITVDDHGQQYDAVVSAADKADAEILYLKKTTPHAGSSGYIHKTNGGSAKELVSFPLKREVYPIPENGASAAFKDWVSGDETKGPNVNAVQADSYVTLKGILNNINQVVFDTQIEKEQQILNMFYFCNYLHDFFYLLGFNTQAGSFENDDPVIARAFNMPINGTANMSTPIDGSSPTMNMGLVAGSGRHTALDSDVVFHEYVHGVTNRLVGGRMNDRSLTEEQSRAMGEGWSDYFALSISNFNNATEKVVTGDWVVNKTSGIRKRPYDDNYDTFLTYGKLKDVSGEHTRGELWCATLMHWTRHLSSSIGKKKAYYICWQSIVDGLKLTNANPSYIDARNSILMALRELKDGSVINSADKSTAIKQFWTSFAKFGMGVNASSQGPWVINIKEDFRVPDNI